MKKIFELDFRGRKLIVEHGELAKQAHGAVLVRYGDTVILSTSVVSDNANILSDFFPLMVLYQEKLYSVGKIPGGFIKREGRPYAYTYTAEVISDTNPDTPVGQTYTVTTSGCTNGTLSVTPDTEVAENTSVTVTAAPSEGYVVDTVTAKIALVMKAQESHIPIISSMGAGNKLDGSQFKVADIYKTKVCPLAKVMRRELKKRGVKKLKVVYSEEQAIRPIEDMAISCRTNCVCPPGAKHKCTERRDIPGSVAFVPSVAGLIIAGEVVKDLVKDVPRETQKESSNID